MRYFVVLVILAILVLQCILGIKDKSAVFDEPAHLPAGYSYLLTGDFRMNPEHPPLTKIIAATPLLFLKLKHPTAIKSWAGNDSFAFGREFLYHSGQDADKIIFWGRIPMVLLSVLLGLLVFVWSKELFGFKAGLFALFLYSFSPNILAHSALVTPDIGLSLFMTLTVYCLWKYLNKPNNSRLILVGITLGLAFLSKFNTLMLIPVFIVLIYIYGPKKKFSYSLGAVFLIFSIAFFIVWAGYGFETGKILEATATHHTLHKIIKDYPRPAQEGIYFLGKNLILPFPSYFKGAGWMLYVKKVVRATSFLSGRQFWSSSFLGFLFAFLIKTPIPFLIFFLTSLLVAIKNKIILKRDQVFLLALPLIIFIANPLSSLALHLKYLLPVYPFLCIFISQLVSFNFLRLRFLRIVFWGMCLCYILGTINIYPHYLAYFNEFIGGPNNGYRYLVDSNLDWGQDLKLLKEYLDKNNIGEIKLAYFGTAEPDYYKINYQRLEPFRPYLDWIAISATYLQGVHTVKGGYDWLKKYEPVSKIGHSIFIYNIKVPEHI